MQTPSSKQVVQFLFYAKWKLRNFVQYWIFTRMIRILGSAISRKVHTFCSR